MSNNIFKNTKGMSSNRLWVSIVLVTCHKIFSISVLVLPKSTLISDVLKPESLETSHSLITLAAFQRRREKHQPEKNVNQFICSHVLRNFNLLISKNSLSVYQLQKQNLIWFLLLFFYSICDLYTSKRWNQMFGINFRFSVLYLAKRNTIRALRRKESETVGKAT